MRVGGLCLISLALGSGSAMAADPAARVAERRVVEEWRVSAAAERHYGPRVALPGTTDQVVVDRGPRLLLEEDSPLGLFQPVFATRRLPARVRRVRVEAEYPLYERTTVEIRRPAPRER